MARPLFFYSDELKHYDMGPQHPMKPLRLRMSYELLDSYKLFGTALELVAPTEATEEEALTTHGRNFLNALFHLSTGDRFPGAYGYGFGTGDNPVFPGMYEASMLYAGASVGAAQAVLDGGPVAFNIAGGLHHAHRDRAAGFCVLNDCAMGIHRLRRKYARVAYVDIDVHHGDGVQELFYSDPSVLTVSLHESGKTLFPGTGFVTEIGEAEGKGFSVNLPYAPGTTGDVWLEAWREGVLPILKAFEPEAILLQLGTDAHYLDPLAHVCLTAQEWLEAVKDVKALDVPIVAVGGGGYNMTTVARMWTLAAAELAGIELKDATPSTYAFRRDVPTLTDHTRPEVDASAVEAARIQARKAVSELKRLLFPRFGLV